jgi:hypothetical protein
LVLRLASIGYFTSEFVRANMQDFATLIQNMLNNQLNVGSDGTSLRYSRSFILDALKHCYHFVKFDEYATEFYDLDSVNAYWTEHGKVQAKSVAVEIYLELVELRARALEHATKLADLTAWLRYRLAYNPQSPRIAKAFRLKEMAWNHFRIFNFYDAERLMNLAVQQLTGEMERPGQAS